MWNNNNSNSAANINTNSLSTDNCWACGERELDRLSEKARTWKKKSPSQVRIYCENSLHMDVTFFLFLKVFGKLAILWEILNTR